VTIAATEPKRIMPAQRAKCLTSDDLGETWKPWVSRRNGPYPIPRPHVKADDPAVLLRGGETRRVKRACAPYHKHRRDWEVLPLPSHRMQPVGALPACAAQPHRRVQPFGAVLRHRGSRRRVLAQRSRANSARSAAAWCQTDFLCLNRWRSALAGLEVETRAVSAGGRSWPVRRPARRPGSPQGSSAIGKCRLAVG